MFQTDWSSKGQRLPQDNLELGQESFQELGQVSM